MTTPDTLAHIEAVLDFAEGPWKPEPDRDGDGLRRQRYLIWLTNDAGDSLQIDEGSAVLLANTYPEALAVVRAATEVMNRYSEQGHCDDSASWAGFDRLDRALAAFLSAARDATEAGS